MALSHKHFTLPERAVRSQAYCHVPRAVPLRRLNKATTSIRQPLTAPLSPLLASSHQTNTIQVASRDVKAAAAAADVPAGEPAQPENMFVKKVAGKQAYQDMQYGHSLFHP